MLWPLRALGAALLLASGSSGQANEPFPLALGGAYTLTDQYGQTRTQADPEGHAQLVFFGYINCPDICTAALPLMAGITDALAAEGITVTPVMITIAPDRDTVESMGAPLAAIHPDYIGLTGDDWPDENETPSAWRFTIKNSRGEILTQKKSYLWSL